MSKQKEYADQIADEFIAAVKAGTAPWQKDWEAGELQLPFNVKTGKRYRGSNIFNLMKNGYVHPEWITLNQAKDLGYYVRKGEKGTPIAFFSFVDEEGKKLNQEDLKNRADDELVKPLFVKSYVFNVSQFDNFPIPERTAPKWDISEVVENMMKNSGAKIFHDQQNRAFYNSSTDEIHLPPKDQFKTQEGYYTTLLHELVHWTGHESRLNRLNTGAVRGSDDYAKEELIAEIGSVMLAAHLGIAYKLENHASYVDSWVRVVSNDPMEITKASKQAENVLGYIMALTQKQEQEIQAAGVEETVKAQLVQTVTIGAEMTMPEKIYIDVPKVEKDEAKALGAKWDRDMQSWYVPADVDIALFSKWYATKNENMTAQLKIKDFGGATLLYFGNDELLSSFNTDHIAQVQGQFTQKLREAISDVVNMRMNGTEHHASALYEYLEKSDYLQVLMDEKYFPELAELFDNDPEAYLERKESSVVEIINLADRLVKQLQQSQQKEQKPIAAAVAEARQDKISLTLNRDYFFVPKEQKDDAKTLGAKWDNTAKSWYAAESANVSALENKFQRVSPVFTKKEIEFKEALKAYNIYLSDKTSFDTPDLPNDAEYKALQERLDIAAFDMFGVSAFEPFDAVYGMSGEDIALKKTGTNEEIIFNPPHDSQNNSLLSLHKIVIAANLEISKELKKDIPEQAKNDDERHYIHVPYEEREQAKALGAKWDKNMQSWYVPADIDRELFSNWKDATETIKQDTPEDEFMNALSDMGIITNDDKYPIIFDGKKHRCKVEGDKGSERSGEYTVHLDGRPAGAIRNFRTGEFTKWKYTGALNVPHKNYAELKEKIEAQKQERTEEMYQKWEETAARLGDIKGQYWQEVLGAVMPYHVNKQIGSRRDSYVNPINPETLIVPAYDIDGKLWSAQYINSDGSKFFAKDSRKEGCFHFIRQDDVPLSEMEFMPVAIICEGYSTGITINEGCDYFVVSAFDCHNLKDVAKAIREKYPEMPILICGDDDLGVELERRKTPEKFKVLNPGKESAIEAAELVGGVAIFPKFAAGEQESDLKKFTDFNDLATNSKLGLDAVKEQVAIGVIQAIRKNEGRLDLMFKELKQEEIVLRELKEKTKLKI